MTTKEALIAMRELLSDPKRWCKGAYARDASGKPTENTKTACSHCLSGALHSVDGATEAVVWAIAGALPRGYHNVPAFNDAPETTHSDILRVLDAAIEGA